MERGGRAFFWRLATIIIHWAAVVNGIASTWRGHWRLLPDLLQSSQPGLCVKIGLIQQAAKVLATGKCN
jgi:hypothetical protein